MKQTILILAVTVLCSSAVKAQSKTIIRDTFRTKGDFQTTIAKRMAYYHKTFDGSLYKMNVIKTPLLVTDDSIIYNVKYITNSDGMLLWGSDAKFTKLNDTIICEVRNIKLIKKSQMFSGISFINVAVDDMEDTHAKKLNLVPLRREINKFFDIVSGKEDVYVF